MPVGHAQPRITFGFRTEHLGAIHLDFNISASPRLLLRKGDCKLDGDAFRIRIGAQSGRKVQLADCGRFDWIIDANGTGL